MDQTLLKTADSQTGQEFSYSLETSRESRVILLSGISTGRSDFFYDKSTSYYSLEMKSYPLCLSADLIGSQTESLLLAMCLQGARVGQWSLLALQRSKEQRSSEPLPMRSRQRDAQMQAAETLDDSQDVRMALLKECR